MKPRKYKLDQTRKLTKKEKYERLMRQVKGPTIEKPKIDPKIAKPQPDNSWDLKYWLAFWASTILAIVSWFHEELIEWIW